jgi:hypothetical protein
LEVDAADRGDELLDARGRVVARRFVVDGRRFVDVWAGAAAGWLRGAVRDVLDDVPSAAAYVRRLRGEGWREVGRGSFAIVYGRGSHVLRVTRPADPLLEFAKIAWGDLLRNPHMPVINSVELRDGFAVAAVERLAELEHGTPA